MAVGRSVKALSLRIAIVRFNPSAPMEIEDIRHLYAEDLYKFEIYFDVYAYDFVVRAPTFTAFNNWKLKQDYDSGKDLLNYCVLYPSNVLLLDIVNRSPAILDELIKLTLESCGDKISEISKSVIDKWNACNENYGLAAESLLRFMGKDINEENYVVGLLIAETMHCIRAQVKQG